MIWFADTEDNSADLFTAARKRKTADLSRVGFQKKITCIGAIREDGEEFFARGDSAREKFLTLLRKEKPDAVYFHNLGYDIGSILGQNALDSFDVSMVGSRMIKVRWGSVTFLDSFNLWPMAVRKIGPAFGLDKLAMDVRSRQYVLRDVEIIRRAILFTREFASLRGVDRLPNTLGGLAVAIWKSFGGENWFDDGAYSRDACFGGRVELFRDCMEGDCHYTDVNSLYPWAMTQKFPTAFDRRRDIDGWGVADVALDVPETDIAPLPVRREDGGIFYPWGRLRGIWTFHEIRNAIKHGAKLRRVFESYGSADGCAYYANYCRKIYNDRLTARSEAEKLMLKLLLNNLYGQLLMGGKVTRSAPIGEDERSVARFIGSEIPNAYGQRKLVDVQVPLPEHVNVSHGAYVTAYGRLRLQDFARQLGAERLAYCDTDSLIFTDPPPFKVGSELGEMKLEGKCHRVECWLPKVYKWNGETKAKGVPRRLAAEFVEKGKATYEQPFRFRESVRYYDRENARPMSVWRPVSKELRARYDKKEFREGRFFPLQFNGESAKVNELSERNPLE